MVSGLGALGKFFADHVYPVVLLGTLVDATGLPFPGRILLVVAGAWAARGDVDVAWLIVLGAAGALAGDHCWYLIGRIWGRRALSWYCRWTLGSKRCVERTRDYYRRFGAATLIIGRFFAGVRLFAGVMAGTGAIAYWRFLVFELLGCVLWSGLFVLAGYALGARAEGVTEIVARAGLVLTILALTLVALTVGIRLWRRRRYGHARV